MINHRPGTHPNPTTTVKIISFDLDGTLVTDAFSQVVWHQGIPQLYAEKCGCSLRDAQQFIVKEYNKVGDTALEWYDIHYWLDYFDLDVDWRRLLGRFRSLITTYPEVEEVLTYLTKSYQLVITSNAAREFLNTEIEATTLSPYFDHIFSATSDFKEVKKTETFYGKLCSTLNVTHSQIIHVGDHYDFDYRIPQQLGMTSYYLDRTGEREGPRTVKDLREFITRLEALP
jgi:putative hydrolase of the HAD superfamily